MICIILRKILNLKDIEVLVKEEVEKVIKVKKAGRSLIKGPFSSTYKLIDIGDPCLINPQKTYE